MDAESEFEGDGGISIQFAAVQLRSHCSPFMRFVSCRVLSRTTIIEALKYAVAGGLPPGAGAKAGQAFVHGTYRVA